VNHTSLPLSAPSGAGRAEGHREPGSAQAGPRPDRRRGEHRDRYGVGLIGYQAFAKKPRASGWVNCRMTSGLPLLHAHS
jgi:hypothetical protein